MRTKTGSVREDLMLKYDYAISSHCYDIDYDNAKNRTIEVLFVYLKDGYTCVDGNRMYTRTCKDLREKLKTIKAK